MKKIILAFCIIFSSFFIAQQALADTSGGASSLFDQILKAGLEDVGKYSYQYDDAGNPKTPYMIIVDTIKIALSFLGTVFLGIIVYAGIRWMTAGGNEGVIGTAKNLILNAAIGILIVLAAYSITYFVIQNLLQAIEQEE